MYRTSQALPCILLAPHAPTISSCMHPPHIIPCNPHTPPNQQPNPAPRLHDPALPLLRTQHVRTACALPAPPSAPLACPSTPKRTHIHIHLRVPRLCLTEHLCAPPFAPNSGLERIYKSDPLTDPSFFEGCKADAPFKNLMLGLAFFHCVVVGRRWVRGACPWAGGGKQVVRGLGAQRVGRQVARWAVAQQVGRWVVRRLFGVVPMRFCCVEAGRAQGQHAQRLCWESCCIIDSSGGPGRAGRKLGGCG